MQSKLTRNYRINLKQNTLFPRVFSFVNLSILLAAIICLCPACDDAQHALQNITDSADTIEQLPLGEGLAIGALAPEFSLSDADGNVHSLSDYAGQKLVVVFYRVGT